LPENAKDTGFDGHIDRITPSSVHWKTGRIIKKQIHRKGFRPKTAYHQEWQAMFFTRPRFAEALAYSLSPFCYFADFRRQRMVWRFSPVGVLGLFATILLPKVFGGIAFWGTTDTFYSGAGDGAVGRYTASDDSRTFAQVAGDTDGTYANYTGTQDLHASNQQRTPSSPKWRIDRAVIQPDTSGLPDTATISAATIYIYWGSEFHEDGLTHNIYSVAPASNTALGTADYDAFGSTAFSSNKNDAVSTSAYTSYDLNASGLAAISKTSYSPFGVRGYSDVNASTPSGSNGPYNGYCSEETGTSKDPYTIITFTVLLTLTCTEDLTLTDTLTKQISKPLTEAISFADTVLKSITRSFSETLSLSDTITKVKLYYKQLTETISLTDTLQRVTTKVLQEAVTLTDTIVKFYGKTYSEAITLTDSIIKQTGKVLSESITFTDSIIKAIAKTAFTEAVTLTDSITKTASRAYTEAVTLTDTIIKHIAKVLTESLTFTDKLKMLKNGVSTAWRKVARALDHTWRKIPRP